MTTCAKGRQGPLSRLNSAEPQSPQSLIRMTYVYTTPDARHCLVKQTCSYTFLYSSRREFRPLLSLHLLIVDVSAYGALIPANTTSTTTYNHKHGKSSAAVLSGNLCIVRRRTCTITARDVCCKSYTISRITIVLMLSRSIRMPLFQTPAHPIPRSTTSIETYNQSSTR